MAVVVVRAHMQTAVDLYAGLQRHAELRKLMRLEFKCTNNHRWQVFLEAS